MRRETGVGTGAGGQSVAALADSVPVWNAKGTRRKRPWTALCQHQRTRRALVGPCLAARASVDTIEQASGAKCGPGLRFWPRPLSRRRRGSARPSGLRSGWAGSRPDLPLGRDLRRSACHCIDGRAVCAADVLQRDALLTEHQPQVLPREPCVAWQAAVAGSIPADEEHARDIEVELLAVRSQTKRALSRAALRRFG